MVVLWYLVGDYWACIETGERIHKDLLWSLDQRDRD